MNSTETRTLDTTSTTDPAGPAWGTPASLPQRPQAPRTPADVRTTRQEREFVVGLLGAAHQAGVLDESESRSRSAAAEESRTRGELAALTVDLPDAPTEAILAGDTGHPARVPQRSPGGGTACPLTPWSPGPRRPLDPGSARLGVAIHAAVFAAISFLMVVLWVATGLRTHAWYPWPIWPIGSWGIGLVSHAVPVLAAVRRARGGTTTSP